MGEILPDGTIQWYTGFCSKCKSTISKNIQGDEIGTHVCEVKEQPVQQEAECKHCGFSKESSDHRLWCFYNIQPSTPIVEEQREEKLKVIKEKVAKKYGYANWEELYCFNGKIIDDVLDLYLSPNREEGRELLDVIKGVMPCTCGKEYTSRRLTAPDCAYCNYAEDIVLALTPSSPPLEVKEIVLMFADAWENHLSHVEQGLTKKRVMDDLYADFIADVQKTKSLDCITDQEKAHIGKLLGVTSDEHLIEIGEKFISNIHQGVRLGNITFEQSIAIYRYLESKGYKL